MPDSLAEVHELRKEAQENTHAIRPKSSNSRSHTRRKSGRICLYCIGIVPALLFIVLLILLFYLSLTSSTNPGLDSIACDPNGDIFLAEAAGNDEDFIWNVKYALTVTLGFGALQYTTAKAVDEVWNLFVGRGFQVVGGLVLYCVFRKSVAQALRQQPRAYRAAIAMQYSTTSLSSLWQYMLHASRLVVRNRESLLGALLLVFASAYVLLSQIWLSAMTGYQAKMVPVLPWDNNTFVSMESIDLCDIVITDGDRVGLGRNYCALGGDPVENAFSAYIANVTNTAPFPETKETHDGDITEFWYNVTSNFTYSGKTYHLNAPSLSSTVGPVYVYDSTIIEGQDLRDHGICQPQKTYKWGFSFLLAFAFLVTSITFSIVLWIFWLVTSVRHSDHELTANTFGTFRTAFKVVELVRRDLGERAEGMTDEEIAEVCPAQRDTVVVSPLENADSSGDYRSRKRRHLKRFWKGYSSLLPSGGEKQER